MSSPMFAMSLDSRQFYYPPSRQTLASSGRRRSEESYNNYSQQKAPIYIRGFPGFNEHSSNVDMDNDSNLTPSNARLDLQNFNGTSDLEDLVDRLQLQEDHNDNLATRRRGFLQQDTGYQRGRAPLHHLTKSNSSDAITELSTLFISMFHTQFCKIDKKHSSSPYSDSFKKFFLSYMRNWEDMECQRCERQFISDFKKKQHDKLSKDEWSFLCTFIKVMEFSQSHKAFQEFCNILKTSTTAASSSPSSTYLGSSPSLSDNSMVNDSSPSCLSQSILQMNALTEDLSRTIALNIDEVKRLYVCIYFPNYKEFWNSDVFILSGSLMKSIDNFLDTYPSLHSSILDKLLSTMNSQKEK